MCPLLLFLQEEPAASRGGGGGKRKGGAQAGVKKVVRGRVKRCSVKSGELVSVGRLQTGKGWFNGGYIFPDGFTTRMAFRSSVDINQLTIHECSIFSGGKFRPAPTFRIVASDRPDEPLDGKSATSCWNMVLARINGEIERRRADGEDLPAPPKTAIAGPEYFGLNQPDAVAGIEALDPQARRVRSFALRGLRRLLSGRRQWEWPRVLGPALSPRTVLGCGSEIGCGC